MIQEQTNGRFLVRITNEFGRAISLGRCSTRAEAEALEADANACDTGRQARRLAWQRSAVPVVYFIRQGTDGPIKIGFTSGGIDVRLAALQAGNPYTLRVLRTIPGGQIEEQELHERFKAHRLQGEWFESTPELLAFIAARGDQS